MEKSQGEQELGKKSAAFEKSIESILKSSSSPTVSNSKVDLTPHYQDIISEAKDPHKALSERLNKAEEKPEKLQFENPLKVGECEVEPKVKPTLNEGKLGIEEVGVKVKCKL